MEWERWGFSAGERCEMACQVFEGAPPLGIGGWQA